MYFFVEQPFSFHVAESRYSTSFAQLQTFCSRSYLETEFKSKWI